MKLSPPLAGGAILVALLAGATMLAFALHRVEVAATTPPPETKDRVPESEMAEMVRGPMELVHAGRRAEADALFRRLLAAAARGPNGRVRAADLLTAYGVQLFEAGEKTEAGDTRRAALPWLRQAVAATRAAWGPAHPETAVALHSLADALREIDPDAPSPAAEQALREALAIRLRALGPQNPETVATMKALADLLSAGPDEAPIDGRRATEAIALYGDVARQLPLTGIVERLGLTIRTHMQRARLYARAGRTQEALREAAAAREAYANRPWNAPDRAAACMTLLDESERLAGILERHAAPAAAESVARAAGSGRTVRCD